MNVIQPGESGVVQESEAVIIVNIETEKASIENQNGTTTGIRARES